MRVHDLRKLVKSAVAFGLYYGGLLHLIAAWRLRRCAVVLMYHRVIPEVRKAYCHSNPGIVVHHDTFRAQLGFLRRFFRIISLSEFVDHMENARPFADKSCLITFDDGWIDNYHTAFPALREAQVPATIFLPYDYIGSDRMFWQEELSLRLSRLCASGRPGDREFVERLVGSAGIRYPEEISDYIQRLKRSGYDTTESVLERVRDHQRGVDLGGHDNRFITWEQAEEMQAGGVAFGSHCLSHRILTYLPKDERREEIERSRHLLASKLKGEVTTIAYPNGDFDETVLSQAREAGYLVGFTTLHGYVSPGTAPHAIPRINIHQNASSNKALLLCTILGIF